MFNRIKVLITRRRLQNSLKPAEGTSLSAIGFVYNIKRMVWWEKSNGTESCPLEYPNGDFGGYLETDDHYRKRIMYIVKNI